MPDEHLFLQRLYAIEHRAREAPAPLGNIVIQRVGEELYTTPLATLLIAPATLELSCSCGLGFQLYYQNYLWLDGPVNFITITLEGYLAKL